MTSEKNQSCLEGNPEFVTEIMDPVLLQLKQSNQVGIGSIKISEQDFIVFLNRPP